MIISLVSNSQASKQTYEVANLKRLLSEHKIVAILPFNVTIAYKHLPKGFDAEGNKREEAKEVFNEILKLVKTNPAWFTQDDLNKIQLNQQFFK